MTSWKDSLQRRDEVKAAFEEGARVAMDTFQQHDWDNPEEGVPEIDRHTLDECWRRSEARARLQKPLD